MVVINEPARNLLGRDVVGETIQDFAGKHAEIVGVLAASEAARTMPVRPTVYFYPNQESVSPDLLGPTAFRVAADTARTSGVLETHVVSPAYSTSWD